MSFTEVFHEIIPGLRISGRNISYARIHHNEGGQMRGVKALRLGLINDPDMEFYQGSGETYSQAMMVEDIQKVFDGLQAQGLVAVVPGVLLANSAAINSLYLAPDDSNFTVELIGSSGLYEFEKTNSFSSITNVNPRLWKVPSSQWAAFTSLALEGLSTLPSGTQSPAYINFDGSNDYVTFSGGNTAAGYLDWTKTWTVGFTVNGYPQYSDQLYQSLCSSGGNHIMVRRGGTNQALYVTSNGGTSGTGAGYSHGINVWYPIADGDRLLFVYDSATQRLKYYTGTAGAGTYTQRGDLLVNATVMGTNSPNDEFNIAKHGDIGGSPMNWHGGLNNFVASNIVWGLPMIAEYMGSTGTDFDELSIWDDMTSYSQLGSDTYPNVVDVKGALTGGSLIDGTEDDFVPIPQP